MRIPKSLIHFPYADTYLCLVIFKLISRCITCTKCTIDCHPLCIVFVARYLERTTEVLVRYEFLIDSLINFSHELFCTTRTSCHRREHVLVNVFIFWTVLYYVLARYVNVQSTVRCKIWVDKHLEQQFALLYSVLDFQVLYTSLHCSIFYSFFVPYGYTVDI